MTLRLRQIALAAQKLAPLEQDLADIFALAVCHRDPAVAEFGLENVLFPLGHQFLEIVAPTVPDTAAGRFLERHGGDGGYMVITQCDDHAPYRQRVATLGVRIAHAFQIDDFSNMQLHPRDTGGSFFEIDEQLGADAFAVDGPWAPAGPRWRDHVRTERVCAIAAAEMHVDDPLRVAACWAAIAALPVRRDGEAALLELDNAVLRFLPQRPDRPSGLAGLVVQCTDRGAVLAAAAARGVAVETHGFALGGVWWTLTDDASGSHRHGQPTSRAPEPRSK